MESYSSDLYELESIQFGVASPKDIIASSVVEVTNVDRFGDSSVYDERMGALDGGMCRTCTQDLTDCPGHFGHINLVEPIPNPLFVTRLLLYFGIFCRYCSKMVVKDVRTVKSAVRNDSYLSTVIAKSKNATCSFCDMQQPVIRVDKSGILWESTYGLEDRLDPKSAIDMLSKISVDDLTKLGLYSKFVEPKNLFFTVLPVMSHINRPFMMQGSLSCDDDLTTLYLDILKNNIKAKKYAIKSEQYIVHVTRLTTAIQTLCNNSSGKAKHPSSGRKIKGLAERFAGKDGLLRNNIMGKRCDQTARAVVAPGPELQCGQVGVPRQIANILTKPIEATSDNIVELQEMCDNGFVDRVDRVVNGRMQEYGVARFCNRKQTQLDPGDIIIRLDKMHTKVVTGHEILQQGDVILRDGVIIPTDYARCRRFLLQVGDVVSRYLIDGDLLLTNRQPTLHTANMKAMNIVIIDDKCFRFPLSDTFSFNMDFDGDEANAHAVQSNEALQELHDNAHTRRTIISPSTGDPCITLVQDTILALYLMTREVSYIGGELVSNEDFLRITAVRKSLGIEVGNCVDSFAIVSSCLPKKLMINTPKFQVVCGVWISGILDKSASKYITRVTLSELGCTETNNMLSKLQHVAVKWITMRGFTIDGNDVEPMDTKLVKDYVESMANIGESPQAIRDGLHSLAISNAESGNIRACVESGAKGSNVNIGQICAVVGQQQSSSDSSDQILNSGRVLLHDEYLTESSSKYDRLLYYGFVQNSFASGLTPREQFIHAIPSRDAIVDTATGTAMTGYVEHRLIKAGEDIKAINGQVIYNSGFPKTFSLGYNNGVNPFAPKLPSDYIDMMKGLQS